MSVYKHDYMGKIRHDLSLTISTLIFFFKISKLSRKNKTIKNTGEPQRGLIPTILSAYTG
jgi:hypothetical protein